MSTAEKTVPACQICGERKKHLLTRAIVVRPQVAELIQSEVGSFNPSGWLCMEHLQFYRNRHVETLLREEKGEITQLEAEVIESLKKHEILASNTDADSDDDLTMGQRVADRVAAFGGSWVFIIGFGVVVVAWMIFNTLLLATDPFDPYPFILLNLVLSCLAALQAPVIIMSQRRQESRDRTRAMHDYQVNLKAELEIRHLHQKVDHLLSQQWERLVEIQAIQLELINEVRSR